MKMNFWFIAFWFSLITSSTLWAAVTPPIVIEAPPTLSIRKVSGEGFQEIPWDAVADAEVKLDQSTDFKLSGEKVKDLLRAIEFGSPIEGGKDSLATASPSGELVLKLRLRPGQPKEAHRFTLYNDNLLEDAAHPGVFYHVTRPLASLNSH